MSRVVPMPPPRCDCAECRKLDAEFPKESARQLSLLALVKRPSK